MFKLSKHVIVFFHNCLMIYKITTVKSISIKICFEYFMSGCEIFSHQVAIDGHKFKADD